MSGMTGPRSPNSKWQTMFARTNRSENPIVKSRRDAHARDERQLFFFGTELGTFSQTTRKSGNNKSFWGKMESMFDLDREQIFVRIVAILGVSSSQPCFSEKFSTSTFPIGSPIELSFHFCPQQEKKSGDKKDCLVNCRRES